jgi:chitinase domain-containing protein 1
MSKTSALLVCLLIFNIHLFDSTLGPGDKKRKTTAKQNNEHSEHEIESANNKFIANDIISSNDIIENHSKFCATCANKIFNGTVLGYVTPWNSKGYDVAKLFSKKIDLISPVWLQIRRSKINNYELSGTHDIDKNWLKDVVSNSNGRTSIVPRILFEKMNNQDLHRLFNDENEMTKLVSMLVKEAKKYKFNGYVLEIYIQLQGFNKPNINHLILDLANGLHAQNKKLYIVIPPAIQNEKQKNKVNGIFTNDDYNGLFNIVDGFSLMTYDYSTHNSMIGPNAPLNWIRANIEYLTSTSKEKRSKILLGLNFYGTKFSMKPKPSSEPILGRQLIELLQNEQVNIVFNDESKEHEFHLKSKQTIVYYPTLESIQYRIKLAEELGTGLSIWELGQGLDYFYDLL